MVPGWYNTNANRSFPFTHGTVDRPLSGPATLFNLPDSAVVDAGFLMGPAGNFQTNDTVYLARIRRRGTNFYFEFATTAADLFGVLLVFTRSLADTGYNAQTLDSDDSIAALPSPDSLSASHAGASICGEPFWSGFLVTGDLTELAALLPADGVLDSAGAAAVIEPALIQNLAGTIVTSIALANEDRTRVTAPLDCPALSWPYPIGGLIPAASCVTGAIVFKAGYNTLIRQNDRTNTILIGAVVGQGEGEPCREVSLFSKERPLGGRTLLDGSPGCRDVLRSINGSSSRLFTIIPGNGVIITPDPVNHLLTVDINMAGMGICSPFVSLVSQSLSVPSPPGGP